MCTGIRLQAKNGTIVYGRTLEFAYNLNSAVIHIPRSIACVGTTPHTTVPGMSWKSTYAAIGANAADEIGIIDGVNEKGLAGGLFYLPGYAEYQQFDIQTSHSTIAPWELMTWILTTCASIAEVKMNLPHITVANTPFTAWGIVPPLHAIVHDPHGNSLVIEFLKGHLHMYDNPLGVITNAPHFEWHMINLSNYLHLHATNAAPLTLHGRRFNPLGEGTGMLGLPGDFTPPSRFVRAAFFSQQVVDVDDADQSRDTAFHILSLFNIPRGVVTIISQNGEKTYDYTQWTSVVDVEKQRYYFHTYKNRTIHIADLHAHNPNAAKPTIVTHM